MKNTIHWHNGTRHKPGTPDYPSSDAVYFYDMACGVVLNSKTAKAEKNYTSKLWSVKPTCWLCLIKTSAKKRLSQRCAVKPESHTVGIL